MDRLHYELLRKRVWDIFPFVSFDYYNDSWTGETKLKATWSFKNREFECTEEMTSRIWDTMVDKDGVMQVLYNHFIGAILKSIEEVGNEQI